MSTADLRCFSSISSITYRLPSPEVCGVARLGSAVWDLDLKKTYEGLPKLMYVLALRDTTFIFLCEVQISEDGHQP